MKKWIAVGGVVVIVLALFVVRFDLSKEGNRSISMTGLFFIEESAVYKVNVSVIEAGTGSGIGISLDGDVLDFGLISKGLTVRKIIELSNNLEVPVKVYVVSGGEAARFLSHEEGFLMEAGSERRVTVSLDAEEVGDYTGELRIVTKRPSLWPLGGLVRWV